MEELLNKLIEKGWEPFGDEKIHSFEIIYLTGEIWNIVAKRGRGQVNKHYSIRDIVSKSSGLWQFVCENKMVDGVDRWTLNARQKSIYDKFITSEKEYTPKMNYEYRIIESALCNEEDLEKFLLDNIKIS